MLCGVDQLFNRPALGLTSAPARESFGGPHSRGGRRIVAVDTCSAVLEELGASPRLIFAPEHGLDATAQAEEAVGSEARAGQTPIISLYGTTKAALSPNREQLAEIDLLLNRFGRRGQPLLHVCVDSLARCARGGRCEDSHGRARPAEPDFG